MKRLLIGLVKVYRAIANGRPSPCRFHPSCSTYALEALEVHGATKGGWLTVKRLARCQPFYSRWGFDPVPPSTRIAER